MEQQAFRIFGLDTSFARDGEVPAAEQPRAAYCNPQPVQLAMGTTEKRPADELKVTVRLADLLPLLIEATQKNRAWIKDFSHDNITISQDLYEVALAYRAMGRAA